MSSGPLEKQELLKALEELALDLHWSWNHATDKVWRLLDPVLWQLTQNPFVILQTVSQEHIQKVLDDPLVQDIISELVETKRQTLMAPAWFQQTYPNAQLNTVAFFSMEFMLSEALHIYSGGLGNVAGDYLKTASDLGVPLIGVGLLYQQGYSRQVINKDGTQQYLFPYNDPGQLPITPLRYPNGERVRIQILLPGYSVWLRAWKVQVGRVILLLLDSNDPANFPIHRGITSELYGEGQELRLLQELVLGIGGWRLLKALGINADVFHLNEGHTAFVAIERARDFMMANKVSFDEALTVTRSGNIFTTHTAVGGGFDHFPASLINRLLCRYITERLSISVDQFLSYGRINAADASEEFNTAFLAIRCSGRINGVSRLHVTVSKQLLAPLFPRWPQAEIPVEQVTNGVHMPTWDSPEADKLWTEACGKNRWLYNLEALSERIQNLPDKRLWDLRLQEKKVFVDFVRERYARQLAMVGDSSAEIENQDKILNPEFLTLGFARRFVAYKRPTLLLHDKSRLAKIINNKERPVQLVLGGKAHQGDSEGQGFIKSWIEFIEEYHLHDRVVFLSDYDMQLTEQMVQGVDVWLNTPSRPWEACGTSGMKVLVNGGLNLSELDGWWDEAYTPDVGWAIGDRKHWDNPQTDIKEAYQLYTLLEQTIIPEFYTRDENKIPKAWVQRMRQSMAGLTPKFSANRSMREYTENYYLAAAKRYLERSDDHGKKGRQIADWQQYIISKWQGVRIEKISITNIPNGFHFEVLIQTNGIEAKDLLVEIYADGQEDELYERHVMQLEEVVGENSGCLSFSASVLTTRPYSHFTPRIIPHTEETSVPLECSCIRWPG